MQQSVQSQHMEDVIVRLRIGFDSGVTRPLSFRREQLSRLRTFLTHNEDDAMEAVYADLGKCRMEGVVHELTTLYSEIAFFISRLDVLARPTRINRGVGETLVFEKQPKGVVLIFSAFNYPIQLALRPVIGAIAAGNSVLLKPSEVSSASEAFLARIADALDSRGFGVVTGGAVQAQLLLERRWDHILYTGNPEIGRKIMTAAAKHLTPVTLELGGKCPVFITASADIDLAASGVVFGRFANSGQTCVACDYVLCEDSCYDKFVTALLAKIRQFFGDDPSKAASYGRMVTSRHYRRVISLVEKTGGQILVGGHGDEDQKYIEPTVVALDNHDDALMREEIFGPVLPILRISSALDGVAYVNSGEKPLALYVYGRDSKCNDYIVASTSSGSAAVNTTMTQIVSDRGKLGGVGQSGIGGYGFETSFETFSHSRPVQRVYGMKASLYSVLMHQCSYFDRNGNHNVVLERLIRIYVNAPFPKSEKSSQEYVIHVCAVIFGVVLVPAAACLIFRLLA